MSTTHALAWAIELKDCDPLQRLAAMYFAARCGTSGDNIAKALMSISEFAEWAGCDQEIAAAAIASLEDFEGVDVYREQDAGFEVTLNFAAPRSPVRAPRDVLLRAEPHWLYVISTATAVKVGITRDPVQRFRGLRTAMPDAFEVRLLGRGARSNVVQAESLAHQALADYRITGEWFNCHPGEALRIVRSVMTEFSIAEMPTK